jgi:hypothetical protein
MVIIVPIAIKIPLKEYHILFWLAPPGAKGINNLLASLNLGVSGSKYQTGIIISPVKSKKIN